MACIAFSFVFWIAQPNTDGLVCLNEQHWWISSNLPTCARLIDELQAQVSTLNDDVSEIKQKLETVE
jgi:hypothetical protein